MSRKLKLTTIGLRTDKEFLVRSMLGIINGKTIDRWTFSDDGDAQVAICGVASQEVNLVETALDAMMSRTQIVLVDTDSQSIHGQKVLGYPVRAADLVELLDSISKSFAKRAINAQRQLPGLPASTSPMPMNTAECRFAFALRELLRLASRHPYKITANGVELIIIPATRSMLRAKRLDETSIIRLVQAKSEVLMSPISERDMATLATDGARPLPIDALLWRIGLEFQADQLLPDLPREGYFALKRWPDFGGMAPTRNHLRMASVLTLAAKNINDLAKASDSTPQQARGFINACALLDLVEIRSEASNAPPLARQHPSTRSVPTKRFSGVFQSIRSALGLGRD